MLDQDTIDFVESLGIAFAVTRTADNRPWIHECYSTRVGPTTVNVIVPVRHSAMLEENVRDNGVISLVASKVWDDHRSVQLKGRVTRLEPPELRRDRVEEFATKMVPIVSLWMSEELAWKLVDSFLVEPAYLLELEVHEVFDQTPGPKAGARVSGGAA